MATTSSTTKHRITNWAVICDRISGQSNYYTVRIVKAATEDNAIKKVDKASKASYGSLTAVNAIRVANDAPEFWRFSHGKGSFEDAWKSFLSTYEQYRI